MSRDVYVYACLEDYCGAGFDSYKVEAVCPECGGPEIEVKEVHSDGERFSYT